MDKTNWFQELKEIDKIDKIIGITICPRSKTGKEFDFEPDYQKKYTKFFQTLDEAKSLLDYEFDSGFGGTNGPYFTAWTNTTVIFPAQYDGSEWIDSVPRNPGLIATEHIGGG